MLLYQLYPPLPLPHNYTVISFMLLLSFLLTVTSAISNWKIVFYIFIWKGATHTRSHEKSYAAEKSMHKACEQWEKTVKRVKRHNVYFCHRFLAIDKDKFATVHHNQPHTEVYGEHFASCIPLYVLYRRFIHRLFGVFTVKSGFIYVANEY